MSRWDAACIRGPEFVETGIFKIQFFCNYWDLCYYSSDLFHPQCCIILDFFFWVGSVVSMLKQNSDESLWHTIFLEFDSCLKRWNYTCWPFSTEKYNLNVFKYFQVFAACSLHAWIFDWVFCGELGSLSSYTGSCWKVHFADNPGIQRRAQASRGSWWNIDVITLNHLLFSDFACINSMIWIWT